MLEIAGGILIAMTVLYGCGFIFLGIANAIFKPSGSTISPVEIKGRARTYARPSSWGK